MKREIEVYEERNYAVVKANEIIQKARYSLGLAELKAFSYIVSKVKPNDASGTEYTFTVNEYCKVLGIDTNNGKNIQDIKKSLKSLRDTSFWLTDENGNESTVGWLEKARIVSGSGKISVRFDEDLHKYICGLYSNYTQYSLLCVLPMKSSYSVRIYELLKSYAFTKHHTFEIEDLKKKLGCLHYERFPDFRRNVLEIATREINEFTDIEISWECVTKGRKVTAVKFRIKQKDSYSLFLSSNKANQLLDGEQVEGQLNIYDLEEK